MNKKTRAVTKDELELILKTLQDGFTYEGVVIKPKDEIATIILCQCNLGLRLSDVLNLTLSHFRFSNDGTCRIYIREKKTKKLRNLPINTVFHTYLQTYALKHNIGMDKKLFSSGSRNVQKYLKIVVNYLGLKGNISSHSFRKFYCTEIYYQSDYDIKLTQTLMLHSSSRITERYIGVEQKKVEKASVNHLFIT